MREFLSGLFEVSLTMGALTALLLALSPVWKRRFRPQWRCWAWLLVALRLAAPLNVSLPQAPVRLETPVPTAVSADWVKEGFQGVELTAQALPSGETAPAAAGRGLILTAAELVFCGWIAGTAAVLGVELARYTRLRRRLGRWCKLAGDYEGLPVYTCALLASPMLVGLVRPRILLPEGVEEERRSFALAHEAMHARRRDLWYKALLLWVRALHWFNPLAWWLGRAAERDLEIACDAAVLADRDGAWRRRYGGALLSFVPVRRGMPLTSQFAGTARGVKERFAALMDASAKRSGRAALAVVLCACLLGGSLVACQATPPEAGQEGKTGGGNASLEQEESVTEEVVVHQVDVERRTITYAVDDGAVGEDSQWREAEVVSDGVDLETLEQRVMPLSSWGLSCRIALQEGQVVGLQAGALPDGTYYIGFISGEAEDGRSFSARVYELEPGTRRMVRTLEEVDLSLHRSSELYGADGALWTGTAADYLEDFTGAAQALRQEGARYHSQPNPYVLTLRVTIGGGYVTSMTRLPPPELPA